MFIFCPYRSNLDPNGSKTDQELWNAIEIAQLKSIVTEFDLGLGKIRLLYHHDHNYKVAHKPGKENVPRESTSKCN